MEENEESELAAKAVNEFSLLLATSPKGEQLGHKQLQAFDNIRTSRK